MGSLPQECGVYLFKNGRGEVIYVGKAVDIQKRVKSHFAGRNFSPFKEDMVAEIQGIDYLLTTTEHEALLLEEELIKTHQPRYNLRLKDDKSYPYIRIGIGETFPPIGFARRTTTREGLYFGPFTNAKKVREGIKLLRTLFLLRGCEIPESRFPLQRPCIDHEFRLCSAPCVGRISSRMYRENLERAVDFLNGDYESVITWLEGEMWKMADALDFESAARYRDHLEATRKIASRYRLVLPQPDDVDFLEAVCEENLGVVVVLRVRKGRLIGSESFVVESQALERVSLLRRFVEDFYFSHFSLPSRVCVDLEEVSSLNTLQDVLGLRISIASPLNRFEEEILEVAEENARKNLEVEREKKRKKEMWSEMVLEELRAVIGLGTLPKLIEGMDISTFQGDEAVGVVVSFREGVPYKKRYRKFLIRETDYPNDYEMLREVVQRYFNDLKRSSSPLPDLLLVDGGLGQLHVTTSTLRELGISLPVLALAKEWEEIYIPDQGEPLRLPPQSEVLQLLQRIRNEAHRFAITFHRLRRNKKLFSSVLLEVKGIGPERRRKLLSSYDTLLDILQVSPQEVSKNLRIPLPAVVDLQERLKEVAKLGISRDSEK
ncbi:MAG: excinuclease ABC subunit UvrC [Atribacterota bacterium]